MMRLTRKGFEAWLRGKHPRTVVASRDYQCDSCPVAKYLRSLGAVHVFFDPSGCILEIDGHNVNPPVWAAKFGHEFDETRDRKIYGSGWGAFDWVDRVHTASRALKILESIK